ncbi:DUF4199 domain-containing protein [Spongiimicrobium sp. 3-5]|uniref:DUF4199 domain-containing protein n=1 Tax=Spongiimicrobium sp. 3-5 TaxID=3332596 RepID=UPI003980A5C7
MKNTVIKFGVYGFVFALLVFLSGLYFGQDVDYSWGEVIGYATMIASLSFVYFGIKHFRDKENGGTITFTKAVVIGLLISLFTAAGIALADFIYTTLINPDFFKEYTAVMRQEGYKGEIPDYGSGFMAMIMFLTVMIIGLIISLLSALILQNKN